MPCGCPKSMPGGLVSGWPGRDPWLAERELPPGVVPAGDSGFEFEPAPAGDKRPELCKGARDDVDPDVDTEGWYGAGKPRPGGAHVAELESRELSVLARDGFGGVVSLPAGPNGKLSLGLDISDENDAVM